MKKSGLIAIVLALILAACSSASSGPQAGSKSSAESLPKATQLLVGTLKLDGTEQDISSEQAGELLPMWQVYGELIASDTAAQAEIDGLVVQIEETMTDEQKKAIAEMDFTRQDVVALIRQQNIGTEQNRQTGNSKSGGADFAPPPDAGMMPAGNPPDAGGMPGGMPLADQATSGSNNITAGSSQNEIGNVDNVSELIQALVELLKSKAEL